MSQEAIQFTKDAARAILKECPEIRIEHAVPLLLTMRSSRTGDRSQLALKKFHDLAVIHPSKRGEAIDRIVRHVIQTFGDNKPIIDPDRIVPLVRARAYYEHVRRSEFVQSATPDKLPLAEPYNDELIVMYAHHDEQPMRMMHAQELVDAGLALNDVRERAISNLKQFVPNLEVSGGQGFYLIKAGGFYESSMILMDRFWSAGNLQVQGELIAAIPSREVLIVTGSEFPQGLQVMRNMIRVAFKEGGRAISPALFAYRNHRFEMYAES